MASKDGVPPGCPLNQSQYDALKRIAIDGLTTGEIAAERGVAPGTVRSLLNTVYQRLDVPGQAQAVAAMYRNGWATWEPPPPQPRQRANQQPLTPFARAYLHHFNAWLTSGRRSRHHHDGMQIALLGALRTKEPDPRTRRPALDEPAHVDDLAHIDGEDGYGHADTGQ